MGKLFSERLKARRRALGLTGKALAKIVGISAPYLSQIEAGLRDAPSVEVTKKLATALGVQVDYLLADSKYDTVVREPLSPYECRIPADCDVSAKLDSMQSDIEEIRKTMDGIFSLLGGALRKGLSGDNQRQKADEKLHTEKRVG